MRILGITLPDNAHLDIALTSLYGVGRSRAQSILDEVGIAYTTKAPELNQDQENAIRNIVEALRLEGDLKREEAANVKRLKDIQSYRGMRHSRHLPARGQRTNTNSRTVRGNVRKTMASGRRKVEKK